MPPAKDQHMLERHIGTQARRKRTAAQMPGREVVLLHLGPWNTCNVGTAARRGRGCGSNRCRTWGQRQQPLSLFSWEPK